MYGLTIFFFLYGTINVVWGGSYYPVTWIFSSLLFVYLYWFVFYANGVGDIRLFVIFVLFLYVSVNDIGLFLGHLLITSISTHLIFFITFIFLMLFLFSRSWVVSLPSLAIGIYFNTVAEQRVLLTSLIASLLIYILPRKSHKIVLYFMPLATIFLVILLGFLFFNERLFGLRDISWSMILISDSFFSEDVLSLKLKNYNMDNIDDIDFLFFSNPHSMFVGSYVRFGYVGFLFSFIYWFHIVQMIFNESVSRPYFKTVLFISYLSFTATFNGRSFFSVDPYSVMFILVLYVYVIYARRYHRIARRQSGVFRQQHRLRAI